jgi:PBP1b-binding outer membrane lipoprotein LpoB
MSFAVVFLAGCAGTPTTAENVQPAPATDFTPRPTSSAIGAGFDLAVTAAQSIIEPGIFAKPPPPREYPPDP